MKQIIRWLLVNGIFGASIYFGLFLGNEGAENIAYFIAWWCFILSLFCFNDTVAKQMQKKKRFIPRSVDCVFDAIITFCFIYHGGIATGIFYAIHIIFAEIGYLERSDGDNND